MHTENQPTERPSFLERSVRRHTNMVNNLAADQLGIAGTALRHLLVLPVSLAVSAVSLHTTLIQAVVAAPLKLMGTAITVLGRVPEAFAPTAPVPRAVQDPNEGDAASLLPQETQRPGVHLHQD